MKYLIILLAALISADVSAGSKPDLSGIAEPNTVEIKEFDSYKASVNADYSGRNKNITKTKEFKSGVSGASLSRSVVIQKSSNATQLENFESAVGELVQKVEDDRSKKSEEHKSILNDSKVNLKKAYDYTAEINTDMLGNEQDPKVQNAFKCSNLRNCDTSDSDDHAIKECNEDQRLSWSGKEWSCIGMFADPGKPNCGSDQWTHPVNDGIACVDYIYIWEKTGVAACQSNNTASHIYECIKKKSVSDKSGQPVAIGNCFGESPEGLDSCTYEGVWRTTGWSGCSKTCGSGTQSRTVTCTTAYCNPVTRPASTQSCNTQRCPISPSYSCPSGYSLSGTTCQKAGSCRYTYNQAPYGGAYGDYCQLGGSIGSRNAECYYGGRTVLHKNISDPSLGDSNQPYYLGAKKSNCTGQGCASGYTARHQVCLRGDTRGATPYCPGGWSLRGGLCY